MSFSIEIVFVLLFITIFLTSDATFKRTSKNLLISSETAITLGLITCWTCPNKTSNLACNLWAPDILCPQGDTVCQSVHRFNPATSESTFVVKRCVLPSNCLEVHVGCRSSLNTSLTECVTCCSTSFCNGQVAIDDRSAREMSLSVLTGSSPFNKLSSVLVVLTIILYPWVT